LLQAYAEARPISLTLHMIADWSLTYVIYNVRSFLLSQRSPRKIENHAPRRHAAAGNNSTLAQPQAQRA
jgi:hypothetical protein